MNRSEQQWTDRVEAQHLAGQDDESALEDALDAVPADLAATAGSDLLMWIANHDDPRMQAALERLVSAVAKAGAAQGNAVTGAYTRISFKAAHLARLMIEIKQGEVAP